MRILDLFCGAGGAAHGYHLAFPDAVIVGHDINPQPRYPFEFIQADAMKVLANTIWLRSFDLIHASPPCQAYSTLASFSKHVEFPDLYGATRTALAASGVPYVIENVIGAPYKSGVLLCGSMFGLKVRRHRNFESSFLTLVSHCDHRAQGQPVGVYGHGQFYWVDGRKCWRNVTRSEAEDAMGIDWMARHELAESIPPAYTKFIGEQFALTLANAA